MFQAYVIRFRRVWRQFPVLITGEALLNSLNEGLQVH